jgi:hypothetical protein
MSSGYVRAKSMDPAHGVTSRERTFPTPTRDRIANNVSRILYPIKTVPATARDRKVKRITSIERFRYSF